MATLLDVPSIPGESVHDTNPNWNGKIQIDTINYDVSQRASLQTGAGLVAGGASMSNVTITKAMDKSTPYLFYKLTAGEPITQMYMRMTRSGGSEGVYEVLTVECDDVLVTSYRTSGSRGQDGIPMETWEFSVGAIKETYDNRNEQGQRVSFVPAGYNFKANTATA
jgi:type VI secretion system secreted protein Hcp